VAVFPEQCQRHQKSTRRSPCVLPAPTVFQ
jgi:hypothetical protein